jgi:hypothetical protein
MSKARKKPKPYIYSGKAKAETEDETEDIYNTKEREQMLDEDEITAAEEGFMKGRED